MTVMPSSGEVADKAVSTEDNASSNAEVTRMEAVLAALVETKVESMKASTSALTKRSGSVPTSPRRHRLTSSSTASSSQNHHRHHHRLHHRLSHEEHDDRRYSYEQREREARHHRRHDSAPCGDYKQHLATHRTHHRTRNGKSRRRDSEQPRSPRKRRKHSKVPLVPATQLFCPKDLQKVLEGPSQDRTALRLIGIDPDQRLALINFDRTREAFEEATDQFPQLRRSSCCFSQSVQQLKIHYDIDDYVALNLDDELEDDEDEDDDDEEDDDSLRGRKKRRVPCERYHRPKRKRKRSGRGVGPDVTSDDLGDPDELPARARWTIVATAFLLLAMSLLLVGVTLRMAPIIDDMGDGRRASVCRKNSRGKRGSTPKRRDSCRPTSTVGNARETELTKSQPTNRSIEPDKSIELERDARRRKIVTIVLGTFAFLLVASILVVVVTLTHTSFHNPPTNHGVDEPLDHRHRGQFRKENEELLNSLNRDNSVPDNSTTNSP